MFKNIGLLNKILCFLCLMLISIWIDNYYDFLWYMFLFLVMSILYKKTKILVYFMILTLFSVFGFYYNISIILGIVLLLFLIVLLFFDVMTHDEKKYLIEKVLYNSKNKNKLIKQLHYREIYNYNKSLYEDIINEKELNIKTNLMLKEYYLKSKLRYYGINRKRTSYISKPFNKYDLKLNFIVLMIWVIIVI